MPATKPNQNKEGRSRDMAEARKKFNLSLTADAQVWLEFEAARRGTSVTGCINEAIIEQRDNAPENVREVFKAFLATREK